MSESERERERERTMDYSRVRDAMICWEEEQGKSEQGNCVKRKIA